MIPKWKKFENEVQGLFLSRLKKEPLMYHRFYDTASANGGFLPAQPGDHLVIWKGVPILIETKLSEKHDSLRSCFSGHVKNHQIGSHRLWLRAGAITLIVFKGATGTVEVWGGRHCVDQRTEGRPLKKGGQLKVGDTIKSALSGILVPEKERPEGEIIIL